MKNKIELIPVNEFGSEITVGGYGFDKFIEKPEQLTDLEIAIKLEEIKREEAMKDMTPKEKAKELVGKYLQNTKFLFGFIEVRKECALIAVDEMLGNAGMIWGGRNTETGLTARDEFRKYWQ